MVWYNYELFPLNWSNAFIELSCEWSPDILFIAPIKPLHHHTTAPAIHTNNDQFCTPWVCCFILNIIEYHYYTTNRYSVFNEITTHVQSCIYLPRNYWWCRYLWTRPGTNFPLFRMYLYYRIFVECTSHYWLPTCHLCLGCPPPTELQLYPPAWVPRWRNIVIWIIIGAKNSHFYSRTHNWDGSWRSGWFRTVKVKPVILVRNV